MAREPIYLDEPIQNNWETLIADPDYQINKNYPYQIRRKSNKRIVTESVNFYGYIRCSLNLKQYLKHRLIAEQWIFNDDPVHKTDVDHINGIRDDNRIENLRWATPSQNQKNTSGRNGHKYTFLDELPDTAEPLDAYNGYEFDGLYLDFGNEKLYIFNGVRYRELVPLRKKGNIRYCVYDIEDKCRWLSHKILFG